MLPSPILRLAPSRSGGLLLDHDTFVRLCRSRDFIAECFEGPISLEDAAREACLSPFHYHRLFARAFGQTPHAFLTRKRIEEAKRMLASRNLTVSEVCVEVGYSSLGSFSALFHRIVGCSPSDYRREAVRFYALSPLGTRRFVPHCFFHAPPILSANRKIEEALAGKPGATLCSL